MYEYNLAIRFKEIAKNFGSKPAVQFCTDTFLTYKDLDILSTKIGLFLLNKGIKQRDVICLSGTKNFYTYALMISCLKIGAIYSVLDPDSPVERIKKILNTCRPKILWGEREFVDKLTEVSSSITISCITNDDSFKTAIDKYVNESDLDSNSITAMNPAYIMYTSGSTGFPKGAVMTHGNVLNLIHWGQKTFEIVPDDVLTNVNPLYFDNSVFDFYSALFTGATLVPFSKEETRDPKILVEKIDKNRCSQWFSVPSLLIFLQTMRATDGLKLKSIKRFIFGGEGYPKAKLKKLFDSYHINSKFFNVYGPTECTCICSAYKITEDDFAEIQELPPLGVIADNFEYIIIDQNGNNVINGSIGELCLLGPNVGLGYYNDIDRTNASFVQNPFNQYYRELMYKTGDLVRFDPKDEKLYIYGRKDNQIKHMGYRIELEEIEAALHCIDYVSEAVVLHTTINNLSCLIAVVASCRDFDEGFIRQDLKKIIPDYMIPSIFYREEVLPKNPNGKVDRKRIVEKYVTLSGN